MSSTLRSNRKRSGLLAEINVVPYIDVMLVLLVIFMITAPLLTQGVSVNLPQASSKALPPKTVEPIIVSVDQTGQYYMNIEQSPNQSINAQQLMVDISAALQLAQQKHEQRDVYVKGDRNANYGAVMQAMVLLQKAGVDNVGLITEPDENNQSH